MLCTDTKASYHRFNILIILYMCRRTILLLLVCLKSAHKSAVRVCQVATVVMETTQLVLSQFKNFLIEN